MKRSRFSFPLLFVAVLIASLAGAEGGVLPDGTSTYPWKTDISTTIFWMGASGQGLSLTPNSPSNYSSPWHGVHGAGGLSKETPSELNPFYVALPFNDLAFQEAGRWVPASWRPASASTALTTSACKDRWVEIKGRNGRICYAQWEDVGPLRNDDAEYVFGAARPHEPSQAGLDVSPAIAKYLGLDRHDDLTSWRFIDAGNVPSGLWTQNRSLTISPGREIAGR